MEKTFLTSNTLRTVSKHLVFTSFPPPNYFALRNSSLPPPPPPPSHAASPGGCASSSPGAGAARSRQAWHGTEVPGPPMPLARWKCHGDLSQGVWKLQGAAGGRAGCSAHGGCRHWAGTTREVGVLLGGLGTPLEVGVLLAGWGPPRSWGADGGVGTPSSPAPGSTPPGKAPGIPAPASKRNSGMRSRVESLPAPAPAPGPSPTWYFRGFPCRAKAGLHRARYHGTCGQQRPLSPGPAPAHPGDSSAPGSAMPGARGVSYLWGPRGHQDQFHPRLQCQHLGASGRGVYQGRCRRRARAGRDGTSSGWPLGAKGTP